MARVFADWLNKNEQRNYPLHDSASKHDVEDRRLPDTIFADVNLMVPTSAGQFVFISSVSITPALVSATFLAADCDPFDPACTPTGSFVPLAVITVARPVAIHRNLSVEALYPGVGGWVAFGRGVEAIDQLTLRFDDPAQTLLLPRAARSYDDLPVNSIGKVGFPTELTGLVTLLGQSGIVNISKQVREIEGIRRDALVIGLNLDVDAVGTLRRFTGPCGARPEDRTCPGKALVSLNGVRPDCNGNIGVRFEGFDTDVVGIESGNIIDLPIGLDDVCAEFDPTKFDPEDLCVTDPSSSSVSSTSPAPEPSESSSSATPPPPAGGTYCDSFSAGGSFDQTKGSWSRQTVSHGPRDGLRKSFPSGIAPAGVGGWLTERLVSGRGSIGTKWTLVSSVPQSGATGYVVEALIRPRTERGNGHVIFGFKDEDDFFFAGVSLDSVDRASGLFYVGHKTGDVGSSLDNFPLGLGQGHQFDLSGSPDDDLGGSVPPLGPDGLFDTDIRVIVEVTPVGDDRLISVSFAWDLEPFGLPLSAAPVTMVTLTSLSDLDGLCGVGAVASETEFDNFGINCGAEYIPGSSGVAVAEGSEGGFTQATVFFPWPPGAG